MSHEAQSPLRPSRVAPRVILHLGGPACGGPAIRSTLTSFPDRLLARGAPVDYWRLVRGVDGSTEARRVTPGHVESGASDSLAGMDTGCLHDVLAGALDEVAYDSLIVFSCDEWGIDLGWRSTWGGCRPRCAAIQIDAVLLVRPQLDCLATMHRNGPSSSVPFGEWIRRDDVANRCDWFSHVEGARRAGVRRVAVRHIGDPLSEFAMALADVADVLAPEVRGSELPLDGPAPPDLAAMLAAVDRLVAEKDPSVLAGNLRVSLQQVGAALDDHLGRVETDSLDDEDRLWVRQRFDEANSNLRRYLKATEAL